VTTPRRFETKRKKKKKGETPVKVRNITKGGNHAKLPSKKKPGQINEALGCSLKRGGKTSVLH